MPLLAHVLLYFAAKPSPEWNDNWAADLLFISISNSGLSAISVFARIGGGSYSFEKMSQGNKIVWALTLVCFCLASLLYGAAVTGKANDHASWFAIAFLVFSAFCSLNFELALAANQQRTTA